LKDPRKFTQIWIFGLKTNHLATLAYNALRARNEVEENESAKEDGQQQHGLEVRGPAPDMTAARHEIRIVGFRNRAEVRDERHVRLGDPRDVGVTPLDQGPDRSEDHGRNHSDLAVQVDVRPEQVLLFGGRGGGGENGQKRGKKVSTFLFGWLGVLAVRPEMLLEKLIKLIKKIPIWDFLTTN
jgi:hypothetical protein